MDRVNKQLMRELLKFYMTADQARAQMPRHLAFLETTSPYSSLGLSTSSIDGAFVVNDANRFYEYGYDAKKKAQQAIALASLGGAFAFDGTNPEPTGVGIARVVPGPKGEHVLMSSNSGLFGNSGVGNPTMVAKASHGLEVPSFAQSWPASS